MQELEELKYQKMINAIEAKIERINAIDTPIVRSNKGRSIGFNVGDKEDIIKAILDNVEDIGDKTPSKSSLVDTNSRREKELYESAMKTLMDNDIVNYYAGKGYYMAVNKNEAKAKLFS